ncbi:hypothetical protein D3C85_1744090 [compost metagenome]
MLQVGLQRRNAIGRKVQADIAQLRLRQVPAQPVGIDQQVALGVAIVGIEAYDGHGLIG